MVKISVTGRVLQQSQSYAGTLMRRIMWSRLKKSEALHYGKGMKDAGASVIKVENRDLKGTKIPGIQNYHSVQFQEKKMFWRYYGVGNGVSHPYNLKVESGATIVKPYRTDKRHLRTIQPSSTQPTTKKVKWNDRAVQFSSAWNLVVHFLLKRRKILKGICYLGITRGWNGRLTWTM